MPEKPRGIRPVHQSQHGRHQVDLTAQRLVFLRRNQGRTPDHGWNVIAAGIQLRLAGTRSTMVSAKNKQRAVKPRMVPRLLHQLPHRIIRIKHCSMAARITLQPHLPVRKLKGPVIARRHHKMVKRLSSSLRTVALAQHLPKQVLITRAPRRLKRDLPASPSRLVDHPVSIASKIAVHVIKPAVAAVDKSAIVPSISK